MHEVGLMAQAVQMALDRAEEDGAARIHQLTVRIGPLTGVEVAALRFAFEVVTQGTAADAAELRIEEVPVCCWCAKCSREFHPTDFVFRCAICRQLSDDVRQGREFDLISMEIS